MHRQILISVWPYLALMVLSSGFCWLLLRMTRARPDWRQLKLLAADERGAVQSLSFVLTIPIFIVVMMFIVQLSQLTIGKFVVEHAAFAAVRSAQVWLPAHVTSYEGFNQVSSLCYRETITGDDGWLYDCYEVDPVGHKYNKIRFAAVQACLAICPSRDVGADRGALGNDVGDSLVKAAEIWSPQLLKNPKVSDRIKNKLAYSLANTSVRIFVRHRLSDPPLLPYLIPPYLDEFAPGEIGWNDQILVTVTHQFALLPGPGRLLARQTAQPGQTASDPGAGTSMTGDTTASSIQLVGGVPTYRLTATAMLHSEGEKSLIPYGQTLLGPSTAIAGLSGGGGVSPGDGGSMSEFEQLQWPAREQRRLAAESVEQCCDEDLSVPLANPRELLPGASLGGQTNERGAGSWPSILRGTGAKP